MKLLIVLAMVCLAWLVAARPEDSQYDAKYDDFNIDEVVANTRLLKAYAHCFIGDGKCTGEAADIKKWIPEATSTSCAKCSEKQKVLVAKVIKRIQQDLKEEYAALIKTNDPDGKYTADLEVFLDKYSA